MSRPFLERCPRRHLVIHMDINKTILQVDPAGSRSMEDILNSNAADNVYGYVDSSGEWKALYGPREAKSQTFPHTVSSDNIVTYAAFIDQKYSEPGIMQTLSPSERSAKWAEISSLRRAATGRFTTPNSIGCRYAYMVEEQRQCLKLNSGDGYHSIVPSFFNLINLLSNLDWSFTLIFRTFGSDLPKVLEEWQQFVQGTHECKPEGSVLRRMSENIVTPRTGCMYRDHEEMYLCLGPSLSASTIRSLDLAKITHPNNVAIITELKKLPNCHSVRQTNLHELNSHLIEYFAQSNNVGGLVDYYPAWAQAAERRCAGKVFPIPFSKRGEGVNYYVFFDDNIFIGNDRSIVDLRDEHTMKSLIGSTSERPFCIPVNAYEAITNEDYFIDCLSERLKDQLNI
ncbi:unnamed protein product [Phytomonas sp. EM1]|nr:unnamed protein product [Phytomonas sp. EM1]|eukprot:CCW60853.1 unnamed protein product [Phytomonas sp. isolate EM1]